MKFVSLLTLAGLILSTSLAFANPQRGEAKVKSLEESAESLELELEQEFSFSYGTKDELPPRRKSSTDKDLPDLDLEKYMSSL